MTELSPAAQAVLDAAEPLIAPSECPGLEAAIAAALRAVAAQLSYGHGSWAGKSAIIDEDKLLAIAAELDDTQSLRGTH